MKREYSYTSGLPCEIGDDGERVENIDGVNSVEDTVDPRERFRQTSSVQLAESDIPEANKRQRTRRPQVQADPRPQAPAQPVQTGFTNFGNNPNRIVPERRPSPQGSPLDNLLNIAENGPVAPAAPVARPFPQRASPTPRPRPAAPRPNAAPRPAAPVNPGSFNFDQELEGFTLNRPSLTFEQNRAQQANGAAFQSQLVFNQNTGTFQTELKQSGQPDQVNNAAPFSVTTAGSTTIDLTSPVTAAPATTRFSPRPTSAVPTPTRAPATPQAILPAGTIKLDFEPLNIPRPSPTPSAARPTSRFPASPSPATVRLPAPTQPAAPVRPAAAAPTGAAPANTFFVFNPFQQGGAPVPSPVPASNPFNTPLNMNAFQIRPAPGSPAPGAPRAPPAPQAPRAPLPPRPQFIQPTQQFRPAPTNAAVAPPFQPQAAPRPQQPAPIRQAPQQQSPFRQAPQQPAPVRQAPQPGQQPQVQFGFQPIQQQPQQAGRPFTAFTAFRNGTPPQQIAAQQRPAPPQAPNRFAPQPQFQPQGQFGGQQLRPVAFNPSAPQAQQGNQAPFSVFGTSQLRGA